MHQNMGLCAPKKKGCGMPDKVVPCKTCKSPVSNKASACPQCGRDRPGGGTSTGVFLFVTLALVLGAAWLIYSAIESASGQMGAL